MATTGKGDAAANSGSALAASAASLSTFTVPLVSCRVYQSGHSAAESKSHPGESLPQERATAQLGAGGRRRTDFPYHLLERGLAPAGRSVFLLLIFAAISFAIATSVLPPSAIMSTFASRFLIFMVSCTVQDRDHEVAPPFNRVGDGGIGDSRSPASWSGRSRRQFGSEGDLPVVRGLGTRGLARPARDARKRRHLAFNPEAAERRTRDGVQAFCQSPTASRKRPRFDVGTAARHPSGART